MIRQFAPPHPQLFPEISAKLDRIVIDFTSWPTCVASNRTTPGLSEIRNAKYVMWPAEDPPVQTIVSRGARAPVSCPVATSERGPVQVTLVRLAANDAGAPAGRGVVTSRWAVPETSGCGVPETSG